MLRLALPLLLSLTLTACQPTPELATEQLRLRWQQTDQGWQLASFAGNTGDGNWQTFGQPSGQYSFLYASAQPPLRSDTARWPGELFPHAQREWAKAMGPVALNLAGEAVTFFPEKRERREDGWFFSHQTTTATVEAYWRGDEERPDDLLVTLTLRARQPGWFSLASPTLATLAPEQLGWGLVPGYFQGDSLQADSILSVVYAQGLPDFPFVAKDRTITTPASILEQAGGMALATILEPGQARHPWAEPGNQSTHRDSRTGFSSMNRQGRLSPTVYAPLLDHPAAQLQPGDSLTLRLRYHLAPEGWFAALRYSMDTVYRLSATLPLRQPTQSLSRRIARLLAYSLDDETSFWREMAFAGETLGAQAYMGGVVGADGDATKNSDIGAMWMMAELSGDAALQQRRLPLVRNFKLAQQEPGEGFFAGAARGQYFLHKSSRWVEEWGSHIEPVGITYYTLADLGNILLFRPEDAELKAAFRAGAERLLTWQQAAGDWVIGYDHETQAPVYTDLRDLRPTFYGMLIAYRILGEEKYLAAAKGGADWILAEAVAHGHFLGVCGDIRFVNDFATGQLSQALLDLAKLTGEEKYREGGLAAARMYVPSIYAHPIAGTDSQTVRGRRLAGWQYTQAGLSFEHGGSIGSATFTGPILLASHAGLFVRMAQETGDPFFASLARAAAWGKDAFVNPETSVASYYWGGMDKGAGNFPHHAWWQIGWLMDYLVSEASYRSEGQINFPAGFMTAKVGPHQPYGFAPGEVLGREAQLKFDPALTENLPPQVDVLLAEETDTGAQLLIFLNNSSQAVDAALELPAGYAGEKHWLGPGEGSDAGRLVLPAVGWGVLRVGG